MGTLLGIDTANTVVLAIISALSVPVPAQRRRRGDLDRRARPRRRAVARRKRPREPVRPWRHRLSRARRPRSRCLQERARGGLLRRLEPLRAHRLHPPGQHHPRHGAR
jgi:hypothetical protein